MADQKITDYTAVVTPVDADLLETVVDVSTTPVNRKITWTVIKAFLKTYFDGLFLPKPTVTAVKSANYSASVGEYVPCDISLGGFTLTLPDSPAEGSVIEAKITKVDSTTVLEIACSGTNVFNRVGGETSIYLNLLSTVAIFTYQASTGIWYADISTPGSAFAAQFSGIDAQTPITNADISIDTTTRVLTITPPLGYFYLNIDGGGKNTRIRKTGTINFPAFTDTSGTWYFYFNSSGTAVTTQTNWTTDDFPIINTVYRLVWNATLYSFTVTAANATVGATYTNNGITYTVLGTIAGGTTLKMSGTGDPLASGTLTKATGTGDATITFSAFSSADKMVAQYIEYHLNDIPADVHQWFHLQGAQWVRGFTISNNALTTGTPNIDGRNTVIGLTTGSNVDDNLEYTITNDSTPTDPWQQDLGDTTPATLTSSNSGQFKTFVQNAGALISFLPATRFPFAWDTATNRPEYITSAGVRTLVASGDYFVYFVYATQNPVVGDAIKIVSAPASYGTLTNARAVTWTDIQNAYPILSDGETRPLYRLLFLANTAWDDATKNARLYETQDLRKAAVTSTSTASGSLPASSVTVVPAGNIASTNAQAALEELDTEKVDKATYDANSILYATDDNTPLALTVGTNTVVGRVAGAITTLAIDSDLSSVSANDDTVPSAKATKAMGDLKLPLAGGTMSGKVVTAGSSEVGKTYTPASGAQTVALDCALNNMHIVTGNASGTAITFTVANVTNSQIFAVSILQGAVVSTITAWFSTIRWASGTAPTLTAVANKRDTFIFIRTGSDTYDGFVVGQNC